MSLTKFICFQTDTKINSEVQMARSLEKSHLKHFYFKMGIWKVKKETLYNEFVDWKGAIDQVDDVCIMGVTVV